MTICSNRFVYRIYKKVYKYINKKLFIYKIYLKIKGVKYNKNGQKTYTLLKGRYMNSK